MNELKVKLQSAQVSAREDHCCLALLVCIWAGNCTHIWPATCFLLCAGECTGTQCYGRMRP